MHAPSLAQPVVASPSPWGTALWRLVAALLYACSLMLIPHDLTAAVLALLAALLCLPGARAAWHERTGLRVGGALTASGAMLLLLCALVRTGLETEVPTSSDPANAALVVSSSLASKP
jgi:hypothetical protein